MAKQYSNFKQIISLSLDFTYMSCNIFYIGLNQFANLNIDVTIIYIQNSSIIEVPLSAHKIGFHYFYLFYYNMDILLPY